MMTKGIEELQALHRRLIVNDETLSVIYLGSNSVTAEDVVILADGLRQNVTVTKLNLMDNNIGDEGTSALADCLHENVTLTDISLRLNNISDAGAMTLADAIRGNASLTRLNLMYNNISDVGAMAMANVIRQNSTLISLYLAYNNICDEGALALLEALTQNATITQLYLVGNKIDAIDIQTEIRAMTGWNEVGALCPGNINDFPPPCKDRVLYILLTLYQLPIDDDLHWHIISMLRVRDIVDCGKPKYSSTWT